MNKRIVIWTFILVGIGIALFLFYTGVKQKNASSNQRNTQLAFKIIQTEAPKVEIAKQVVIRNEAEWATEIGTKTDISFTKEMVLVFFMGTRMTGGYSIEISSVVNLVDKIVVSGQLVSPGKNCIVFQAINYPYLVFTIPTSNKEIVWNMEGVVRDCP